MVITLGYPVTKGTKVSQMELRDLFEGLKLNKVNMSFTSNINHMKERTTHLKKN